MRCAFAFGLSVLAIGCSAGSAVGGSESRARPMLQVIRQAPLTVRGRDFQPAERVRVIAAGRSWRLRATPRGAFVLTLGAGVDRCNSVRVLAVGSGGSRAILKILPSPACAPARSP